MKFPLRSTWGWLLFLSISLGGPVGVNAGQEGKLNLVPQNPGPDGSIVLEDGTYAGGFYISRSGTAETPFILKARHPHKAIIRGQAGKTPQPVSAISVTGDYVVIEGLQVEDGPAGGIFVTGKHVTIRNCVFDHNGWEKIGVGIFVADQADDVTIENTECLRNRSHGVYISGGADRPTIVGNRLHDNGDSDRALGGNGLQINADGPGWPTEKAIIQNNIAYRNHASGISLQGVQDSLIANNLLYDNHHLVALGVVKGSKNNRFFHNTVVARPVEANRPKRAVWVLGDGNRGPSSGNKFFNNILFAPGGKALAFEEEDPSKTESDYNILWSGPGRPVVWDEKTKLWSLASWQATGHDVHSIAADPNFVDPEKNNFHLRADSPALKRGQRLELVSDDLSGNPRAKNENPSLGAFEATPKEKK